MDNLTYERITKENASEANEIMHLVFCNCDEEEQNFFNPYEPEVEPATIENYYIKCNDKVVGICGFYIPYDDPKASWQSWLAIYPQYRKKGIAEKAVKYMNELSNKKYGISTYRVYTSEKNEPAIKLYEKCGYIREPKIHKEAIVFTKDGEQWLKEPIW